METYKVIITGTYRVAVEVQATSPHEAEDKAYDTYTKPILAELVAEQGGVEKVNDIAVQVEAVPYAQEFLPFPATISIEGIPFPQEPSSRRSLMGHLRTLGFFSSSNNAIQTKEIQAMRSGQIWRNKDGKICIIDF